MKCSVMKVTRHVYSGRVMGGSCYPGSENRARSIWWTALIVPEEVLKHGSPMLAFSQKGEEGRQLWPIKVWPEKWSKAPEGGKSGTTGSYISKLIKGGEELKRKLLQRGKGITTWLQSKQRFLKSFTTNILNGYNPPPHPPKWVKTKLRSREEGKQVREVI